MRDERDEAGATLATWLEERRAIAERATRGPWKHEHYEVPANDDGPPRMVDCVITTWTHPQLQGPVLITSYGISPYYTPEVEPHVEPKDAAFIAANDPATVTLMLDVIAAAEHLQSIDRELHTSGSSEFWSALADMYERLDALEAHLRGNAGTTP